MRRNGLSPLARIFLRVWSRRGYQQFEVLNGELRKTYEYKVLRNYIKRLRQTRSSNDRCCEGLIAVRYSSLVPIRRTNMTV